MKKVLLGAMLLCSFFSCTENGEQINVVKNKLSSTPLYQKEVSSMKFECLSILDSDIYEYNIKKTQEFGDRFKQIKITKYQDSLSKSTGKKCYKVHFFRLIGKDTVNDGFILLNENNKIVGFKYKK